MEFATNRTIVVTGAGGFIGGALVANLRRRGVSSIRAVDVKPFGQWYQHFDDVENVSLDLNLKENCEIATRPKCTTLRQIWAGWALSSRTKPCACFRS